MVRACMLMVFSLFVFFALLVISIGWGLNVSYNHDPERLQKGRGKPASKVSFICITLALILALVASAAASGRGIYNVVQQAKRPEEEPAEDGEEGPASVPEPAEPEDESVFEPAGPVRSVAELHPSYFSLSAVQNSELLQLFWEISPKGILTASGLKACGEEFENHLERCVHPRKFFSFYDGLEQLFPKEEGPADVEYDYKDVETYEESMSQIRGSWKSLRIWKELNSSQGIYSSSNHLAIRAKDALYFGKNEGVITDQMTWVVGEIAFGALINEYVYGELAGSTLSDWYYRFAQILEYVGDIADTEELRLELYYVAAVCYSLAYGQIYDNLFQAGGKYGDDIWGAYSEMVYKVAVRVNGSDRQEFFRIILSVEMNVSEARLPESRVERSQKKLEQLSSYQSWKVSEDGIKAAQELAAQRKEVKENG